MPSDLQRAVFAHKQLVEQLRAAFPDVSDEDLAGTIEGEMTIDGAIAATIREALAREAMAEGIKQHIEKLNARWDRLESGASTLRAAARTAMEECNLKRIPAPDFTASLGEGRAKVIITDKSKLPDRYLRRADPEPDKKAIAEALKIGDVAGATMGNTRLLLKVTVT
jgi:hypothetical protein